MDIWPLSFFWIDQNEDIASAMCWRWLQTLGKRCVEKAHQMQVDRLYANGKPSKPDVYAYGWNYGIYAAEMRWLELYTYPNDVDKAPRVFSLGLGELVQTTSPKPIALHCAIIHTLIGVPYSLLDELDTWNNALITSHMELCEPVYPRGGDGYQSSTGFYSWRYLALRAMREWEYKHPNRSLGCGDRKRL